jgi:hypothetical protein
MVFAFFRQRKRQKYLIYILGLIILTIFLIVWFSFIKKPPPSIFIPPFGKETLELQKIEINFESLKEEFLKELKPIEKIKPFEETTTTQLGRENPFLPY